MNESIKYWIALNKISKLGPATLKKLYDHFGSGRAIWEADIGDVSKVEGINRSAVNSIIENRGRINLDGNLEYSEDVQVLSLEDPGYPESLKHIYDPPSIIYVKGKVESLAKRAMAIVGTRKPSSYGVSVARKLSRELSGFGFVVVSGMAYGIDTAAHEGALESGGGTIAVFGSGVDVIYPFESKGLAKSIEGSGCLVSEFPPGDQPEIWKFPLRNRIISGLSLGTIVVEGAADSGSLITAKSALEQGREVFAIPGSIENDNSKGPHWLIKQGAKLVESVEDVLEELNIALPKEYRHEAPIERDLSGLSENEKKIYHLIAMEPLHIDAIAERSELPPQEAASILMVLEIKGFIKQLSGKTFTRC